MVPPDNVLFEDNVGRRLRKWMMELCDVHTILRLPTGIFYSPGVKTNVAFLTRGGSDRASTKGIWVYDMRANMPAFGKTSPLTKNQFANFEACYGDDPYGHAPRTDQGEAGRFASTLATRSPDAMIISISPGFATRAATLRYASPIQKT